MQLHTLTKNNDAEEMYFISSHMSDNGSEYKSFYFEISRRHHININFSQKSELTPYREAEDKKHEYGVITKFEFNNNKIICLAGLTEDSTKKLGWYFKHHWEDIYKRLQNDKGRRLSPNDTFAVAIRIINSEVSEDELSTEYFTIIQTCI